MRQSGRIRGDTACIAPRIAAWWSTRIACGPRSRACLLQGMKPNVIRGGGVRPVTGDERGLVELSGPSPSPMSRGWRIELIDRPTEPPIGVGEAAGTPVPAVIANAVFDATGVRLRTVPFRAARVRAALSG